MVYVVDLDDTLVLTKNLNNDAYNFALEKHGQKRIKTAKRKHSSNDGCFLFAIRKDRRTRRVRNKRKRHFYCLQQHLVGVTAFLSLFFANLFWDKHTPYTHIGNLEELMGNMGDYFL